MLLLAAAFVAGSQPQIFIFPQAVQPPHSTATCNRSKAFVAGAGIRYDGKQPVLRKLTELPPGNMYVAVMRVDENGCGAPIIVKYDVGR